jgi:hypothetical protein
MRFAPCLICESLDCLETAQVSLGFSVRRTRRPGTSGAFLYSAASSWRRLPSQPNGAFLRPLGMPPGGPVSLPSGVTAARVAKRVVDCAERKRPDPPIDAAGRGLSPAPLSRVALMTKQRRRLPLPGARTALLLDLDYVPPYHLVCFVTLRRHVRPSFRFVKCHCVAARPFDRITAAVRANAGTRNKMCHFPP